MENCYTEHWSLLPDNSRVWLYQADRELSNAEQKGILEEAEKFLIRWTSHGEKMRAAIGLLHHRVIAISVDEEAAKASGCGIDASVHFVKSLGKHLEIDFFDRQQILYKGEEEQLMSISMLDIQEALEQGRLDNSTEIFDITITDKQSLIKQSFKPLSQAWTKTLL